MMFQKLFQKVNLINPRSFASKTLWNLFFEMWVRNENN